MLSILDGICSHPFIAVAFSGVGISVIAVLIKQYCKQEKYMDEDTLMQFDDIDKSLRDIIRYYAMMA